MVHHQNTWRFLKYVSEIKVWRCVLHYYRKPGETETLNVSTNYAYLHITKTNFQMHRYLFLRFSKNRKTNKKEITLLNFIELVSIGFSSHSFAFIGTDLCANSGNPRFSNGLKMPICILTSFMLLVLFKYT